MPSTPGAGRGARWRMLTFATLILCFAGAGIARADQALMDGQSSSPRHHELPHYPHPPQQNHPPPEEPQPPEEPPQTEEPAAPPAESNPPPATHPSGGGTAGAVHKGGSTPQVRPRPQREVIVEPVPSPAEPKEKRAKKNEAKEAKVTSIPEAEPAASPPESNPERSNLADRILAPNELDLSAENLAEGGLLAFLLVALLYLPVMIFNKATEKNHAAISAWFARPRAWLAAITARIPFNGHPLGTLAAGVVASTVLFAFVEPHFPNEEGAWQYALGMLLGFALVSTVFFATWRWVIHWIEPQSAGRWVVYPPYILLAAVLVVFARLAHFLPGVVLGTVAEYEPAKKLNRRTAGIRVANTYGALMILGLVAWFAWIPVSHAAEAEHASALTLILDSMLAITFVSSLETVAFGLIPMRFLDGNDLFRWHKGLWALMWGAALFWFALVILNPALSTYAHVGETRAIWLILLFSSLMIVAVSTWGYFRVREVRLARADPGASG